MAASKGAAMNVDLTDPKFHNEDAAREWLEESRWQGRPWCPHCGSFNVLRTGGEKHRDGLFHCPDCRGQFTVRTGQVMERSHVPLAKWVLAYHLMASSKKGVSAHQLHRTLKVAYNTAWFMAHRIRESMDQNKIGGPLGGEGKVIEADELYQGKRETPAQLSRGRIRKPTKKGRSGPAEKREIVGLVERGGAGRMTHMNHITAKNLREHVVRAVSRKSKLHTDESRLYDALGYEFHVHEAVHHGAGEYARGKGPDLVTTNNVEGMFGVFVRGMIGVYQHCGEQHLQRYLNEFSFRYSYRVKLGVDDAERAVLALRGGEGKRLTWRPANEA
jgi:transposase-like protein